MIGSRHDNPSQQRPRSERDRETERERERERAKRQANRLRHSVRVWLLAGRRESRHSPLRRKLDEKDEQLDELQADLKIVIVVTASPSVHHNMTPRPAGEAALSDPGVGRRNGADPNDAGAQREGCCSRGVWVKPI